MDELCSLCIRITLSGGLSPWPEPKNCLTS